MNRSRTTMHTEPYGIDTISTTDMYTGITTYIHEPQSTPLIGESSSITDTDGPKTIPLSIGNLVINVPSFKACSHYKVTRKFYASRKTEASCANRQYRWHGTYCGVPGYGADLSTYYGRSWLELNKLAYTNSTILGRVKDNIDSFTKYSFLNDSSLLNFRDSFNVLNFIAELKDVRRLPELIKKWTKTSYDVSDKFLGINFGLLPFASDITSITDRLAKFGPSIDKWNEFAAKGKVLNYHKVYPLDGFGILKDKKSNTFASDLTTSDMEGGRLVVPCVNSTIKCLHEVEQSLMCKVHFYLVPVTIDPDLISSIKRSVWGVDKPISALWAAIPFSFVVDWFVDVGKYIDAFEQEKPHLQYKIVNVGYSLKIVTKHKMTLSFGNGLPCGTYDVKYVDFIRNPLDPKSVLSAGAYYGPLQFKTLDQKQALLGSALMHQLLR